MLGALDRAIRQERHHLQRTPHLLWQQLANRLEWGDEQVRQIVARHAVGARPRLRCRAPVPDTPGQTLVGHSAAVLTCAVSPDGRRIASGSIDQTLKIWDATSGTELNTLTAQAGWVRSCAFRPSGETLVSGAEAGAVMRWDLAAGSGEMLGTHAGPVRACAFSPDGSYVVSAGEDDVISVWDVASGTERFALSDRFTRGAHPFVISGDGRVIVSVSNVAIVLVSDAATGAPLATTARAHDFWGVTDLAISADGARIASAQGDSLTIWDLETGGELMTLTGPSLACAIAPDAAVLVSCGDETVEVRDALTGAEQRTLDVQLDVLSNCVVTPDGSAAIVWGNKDPTLFDLANGERAVLAGHSAVVRQVAVSPDGTFLVTASDDHTLKVWRTLPGAEGALSRHENEVQACAVSFDGDYVASVGEDETLRIWDAGTGVARAKGEDARAPLAIMTDSAHVVTTSSSWDALKIWAVAGGAPLVDEDVDGDVGAIAVSPIGGLVVVANDAALELWDPAGGRRTATLEGHDAAIRACSISSDGTFVVSASDDETLKIWDTALQSERATLAGHEGSVTVCAISADGTSVVSGSDDQTLKIWDADTGAERATLTGHRLPVRGCAISPDGTIVISATVGPRWIGASMTSDYAQSPEDVELKVWDVATHTERATLDGHVPLGITPDGRHLVAACATSNLRVWDARSLVELTTLPLMARVICLATGAPPGPAIACGDELGNVYLIDLVDAGESQ